MTEQEWLECTNPQPMLMFLQGKVSDRRLRLYAVSCSRRFLHLTRDRRVGEVLDIAERLADGLVADMDRSNARKAAQQAAQVRGVFAHPEAPKWERRVASLAYYSVARKPMEAAWNVPGLAVEVLIWHAGGHSNCDWQAIKTAEMIVHSDLLRDIFGNPFRPIAIDSSWLAWNDGTIPRIAQTIYDERAFDRLPIFADALQDAGCDNADILSHCRIDGPHVRGCWVVDLLLSKQ